MWGLNDNLFQYAAIMEQQRYQMAISLNKEIPLLKKARRAIKVAKDHHNITEVKSSVFTGPYFYLLINREIIIYRRLNTN